MHPLDEDAKHIQSHAQDAEQNGDPDRLFEMHNADHLKSMQLKNMAAMQQQMAAQQPQPGGPARPGAPGGAPGQPQPGGQPAGPRLMRGPPGMVRTDNLPGAGALTMPRRA